MTSYMKRGIGALFTMQRNAHSIPMYRLLGLLIVAGSGFFASNASGTTFCQCPPSIFATVNSVPIAAGDFITTSLPGNAGYQITANINNPTYTLILDVTTNSDPSISFGIAISGDPTVDIIITQPFLGGPFPTLTLTGSASLSDTSGDGAASLSGSTSSI